MAAALKFSGRSERTNPLHPNDTPSPLEVELTNEIRALLAKRLPPGSAADIGDTPFWRVKVRCAGSVPFMAFECCLAPGHTGRCFCNYKGVEFTPEPLAPEPDTHDVLWARAAELGWNHLTVEKRHGLWRLRCLECGAYSSNAKSFEHATGCKVAP